ncbi:MULTISPECIES: ATP-binding protein [unclassified Bacteroides]|jgi:predicted AAA+ superfamily ATPase|uniref:ATP-binding protein n=1 Tax=unclassified Bacteroides TaxID=2646097 RepID=UPI000E9B4B31|nr:MULTISPECIES: AAA family ATPase [unclassified Bacteroides]RGN49932.1 ATP-binding protein [Bacteroides sp. OM05-12]RHR81526.1 ATP-binding protein [Bacteroides sp. AF16-49]
MEAFYRTHNYLVEHTNAPVRRDLMDEINWNDRLIGIKGTRGVGKTTFLLQYAKEKFGTDRSCLFINMNNFYFSGHSMVDFAYEFQKNGGKVLLIDQVFKYPDWSRELRMCYDRFPNLKIVFTGSSVMRLKEENLELSGIVKSYNLRGFSFREFLNLQTGNQFHPYSLEDILKNHEQIVKEILPKVKPLEYFQDYMHHGFYPFFLEKRNFSENLLKTMNMMVEVDILLIKQIELKYLSKIKKLLYLLAVDGPVAPNVSQLASDIQTSRATVMNYIKYLADARLINMVYPRGEEFPKKPSKIMMHNTNLMYSIYPVKVDVQDVLETFFMNTLYKDHKLNKGDKGTSFLVDGHIPFRICTEGTKIKNNPNVIYALQKAEVGHGNQIPLWLFGFLY